MTDFSFILFLINQIYGLEDHTRMTGAATLTQSEK